VFYNLISNAIKYNDKEKPVIEIDCPIPQPKDDEVMVFVKDNGIGIDKNSYDEVFKIFRRLHARNEYEGGTGAGLAIVKKIMDEHGARIWIEGKVGEGTVFYLSFAKKDR
ncbi:MAG: ATP-binding protein, partial [Candidatus Desantisbacteria bacterium]